MEILTQESVETLRLNCTQDSRIINRDFEDIVVDLNLQLIEANYTIDDFSLLTSQGKSQDQNKDNENCSRILQYFHNFTPADATDERLWVTLGFREHKKYACSRWPFKSFDEMLGEDIDRPKEAKPKKTKQDENTSNLLNHWFCSGARARMRDHAISRLWWMAYIARKVDPKNPESVLASLFFNSDYRSSLLERNTSANAINVVIGILKISQTHFVQAGHYEYNRDNFREFMKQVDLVGKRTKLLALSVEQIVSLLTPYYRAAYAPTKKTIVQKILGQ